MRLLLDTRTLLWWLFKLPQLGALAQTHIASPSSLVHISVVSGYEIRFKQALGKLEAPDDLEAQVTSCGFRELPVVLRHAMTAGDLPTRDRDPFDRILVAQARCEGLTLVTADRKLAAYDVPILDAAC
ncbi:MAG: type II toxin-antitoxin system VapC family toxin [Pseudonocardia sp.]|nr:type II toxin-antitoxin system VapC family toxin [Pseudonocardia sp.]